MKIQMLALLLPCLLLPACGDDAGAAPKGLGEKFVGAIGEKTEQLSATLSGLATTMSGIKDGATAQAAKQKLEELLGKIQAGAGGGITKLLGASGGSIKEGVMTQLNRLLGSAEIKQAIGPVLEQLQTMLK